MKARFLNLFSLRSLAVRLLILCALGTTVTACSTVAKVKTNALVTLEKVSETTGIGNNPDDPLEGFNRSMFNFNESLDATVLKPTAQAYQTMTPDFVQTGIGNFFGNIGDAWTAVNNVLQGNIGDGVNDILRFGVNTTFGLAGFIDIASAAGMPKHRADFGQTLGVWGVPSGPFVMLPILGASTLRDTIATPIDFKGDLLYSQTSTAVKNSTSLLKVVDKRAAALDAVSLIEEAALDKYVFIRGAYLQRRESQISAGKREEQE
ncbi:VacJ family lipoprotein [Undibacterium seohonense]|jgi:phospholipid-binding lipoprotein MlaA|uniref:VacJ family lipoprotein n=1 Tax=Undibacterium seohonense TaxID=1344950 RepID=A0ABR6X1K6_9BURK|nr:VacJ family lipoprotein [Undibacterium seohonense]MBC3806715.1 VacJ family lipoprotein [Undibacterium seohonense]